MAVVYNINVKSKFELFLNDDLCDTEPDELVKKLSDDKKKKELAQKEARKQKQNEVKKTAAKPAVIKEVPKIDEKGSHDKAPRFQKNDTTLKSTMKKSPVPMPKPEISADDEVSDNKNLGPTSRRPFVTAPKKSRGREFDRHSGSDKTGVKSVERRDGSGAYNWGNVKDMVDLAQEAPVSELKETTEEKLVEPETSAELEKKEPEKPVMTMSEWKALQSGDKVISSQMASVRHANNGENVFTGMNVYTKKKMTAVHHHEEADINNEEDECDDEADSRGRRQIKVNVEFSGRARRGRVGFTNPRSKREDHPSANKDEGVINLDEEEFPTLS